MKKFQNKYRIPSTRLKNWDYSSNGAYFITICTHNKEHFFGEIVDMRFIASELGKIAEKICLEIPKQFSFVELGNFVIMPNHMHGILIIDKNAHVETQFIASDNNNEDTRLIASENNNEDTRLIASENNDEEETRLIASENNDEEETRLIASENNDEDTRLIVSENNDEEETRLIASLREKTGGFAGMKNPMFHDNISRIIRWYKGRCSFEIRKIHAEFSWQSLYHDHIIRDSQSFDNIQNYIENNPEKWKVDKFFQ